MNEMRLCKKGKHGMDHRQSLTCPSENLSVGHYASSAAVHPCMCGVYNVIGCHVRCAAWPCI